MSPNLGAGPHFDGDLYWVETISQMVWAKAKMTFQRNVCATSSLAQKNTILTSLTDVFHSLSPPKRDKMLK